ncbi:MAG TPA: redoxin domain-containing protein [Planctomycetota bacterium]|nr:redoxin domain-containing protein [Planctomycetota bacterium]
MNRGSVASMAWLAFVMASCATTRVQLQDLDGKAHDPLAVGHGAVHVLLFTSHECPIANAYAPTLRELASSWSGTAVRLFVIHVDPDLTVAAARTHARDYELPGSILLDPHHQLARAVGATKTPEAVVLTGSSMVYRGRIDDQWRALGSRAQDATSHDLRDAVAAALAGRAVAVASTPVVGCLLPEARE